MEWPAADNAPALAKAVKAFFDSPGQEPSAQSLERLLPRLQAVRRGDQPELWDKLIESLADACRDPTWREPIERAGLLKYCLESLDAAELPVDSSKQLLRAIGNGVADRDESRAVVLPFLDKIMSCLQNPALLPVAISVLYNTCLGYDPAQKEAAGLRLDRQLCRHLSDDPPNVSQLIELLAWVSDKLSDDVLGESEDCLNATIQYLSSCEEWEDFKHLIAAASVYLQDSSVQAKVLHSDGMSQITTLLKQKTDQLDQLQASMRDDEKKGFLEDLRIATGLVMNAIAAITASDDFTRLYTLSSPLIREQGAWLSSPSPILRTCACITLGNIAVSDAVNIDMVHEHSHHLPTLRILATSTDRTELYLAAGFLRHLAQPAANVEPVTAAQPLPTLAALLDRKEPELDFEAAAVLRRLVNNSRATAVALAQDTPTLDKLLTAAKQTKTGFEVGRLLIAICRRLSERQSDEQAAAAAAAAADSTDRCWTSLLAHDELLRPLVLMVRQEQVPALASEAWFGLGLVVASSPAGARKVVDAFEDEDNWNALRAAVTTGDAGGADRKNVVTTVNVVAQSLEEGAEKQRWVELAKECWQDASSAPAITQ
ncbi:gtp binding protein [Diplodia corticola]|uniref:Gtp binding protein n=1 Tax=Diplodia corticola TaxID=236234 RepID=A0A1J9SJK4_9PEZI|nr:gtp binding protein [Diplodia corticola]OJD39781.1 gtp binding protein [Diplodia corticola]